MLPFATAIGIWMVAGSADLNMQGVLAMAWIVGIGIMVVAGALPGLVVKERFKKKIQDQDKVKLWASVKGACSSPAFIILVAVIVLNTLSGILAMGIDQYLLVYFMNNGDKAAGLIQKGLLSSGYAVVGFASIPVITWLAGRFGKKGSLFFVYGLMVFGGIMKWFIFTPGHPIFYIGKLAIDPIMLIDPLLCGPMWVAVKIMLASMMADICDDDELKHGQRREGMFSAVFSWMEKMVVSLAYFGTGLALAFARFNPDLGGNQAPETFTRMRLFLAGAPAFTAVLAIVALVYYPITAARAEETRRRLEERRGSV
jgi:GPH family glycoside/pentoside/hexuronide:cation symporter